MSHKDPERRRKYKLEYYHLHRDKHIAYAHEYALRNKKRRAEYNRQYAERLKRGEIQLPPLDWAICARGGSEAQARAHQRRGEKACPACAQATYNAREDRAARRKRQVAA